MFYLHARHTLATLRLQALDTEPYDTFSKSSYNDTQFKRFRCTQPLHSKCAIIIIYLSQEPSNLPSQMLPACTPNKHIERTLLSSDYS